MRPFFLSSAWLFGLGLGLPLIRLTTGFPPDVPLAGVETPVAAPRWSWAGWWEGTLQSEFDDWWGRRIGLRGFLVRTANQFNYSLFRQVPYRGGTRVRLGANGFLFEQPYLTAYHTEGDRSEKELREISAHLRRLQDRLAADGVAFLLIIAPSKAEVYPEYLPPDADVAGRPLRRSNYDKLIPFLRADGIHLVDGHELFLQWKREPGAPLLFSRGGTHWNQYGAARIVAVMLQRLRELTGKDLPQVRVTGAVTNRVVGPSDNDLGELLNLWTSRWLAGPQVHPVLEIDRGRYLPDILFIGDSFVFTLTNLMDREGLYRRRNTYYYYNREYFYPEAPNAPLDKRRLDVLAEVRARDAVVIEVNEYWLPRIGFGFARDLLRAYYHLDRAAAAPDRQKPEASPGPHQVVPQ